MRRERNWIVVLPNEGKEGLIEEVCGPIVRAYGGERVGGSYLFGPRLVYEVPTIQCAGVKDALKGVGFDVPHEFRASQLARALVETTLADSVEEALEVLDEEDEV